MINSNKKYYHCHRHRRNWCSGNVFTLFCRGTPNHFTSHLQMENVCALIKTTFSLPQIMRSASLLRRGGFGDTFVNLMTILCAARGMQKKKWYAFICEFVCIFCSHIHISLFLYLCYVAFATRNVSYNKDFFGQLNRRLKCLYTGLK